MNCLRNRQDVLVSVVIPTFNRAKTLTRAVNSVLRQTYRNLEVIIVDDGSTDDTAKVARAMADNRIKYVRQAHNGAAATRNTGIKLARGEYVAFQDSDDEWLPEKIMSQLSAFGKMPHTHLVYTDMMTIRGDGSRRYFKAPDVAYGELINKKRMEYQVFGIGIQTALIKKWCCEDIGYFDERLPRFIDLDFFIRLAKKYTFFHLKEPMVRYFKTDGITSNQAALVEGERLLLRKYRAELAANRRFISYKYYRIGDTLFLNNKEAEGMKYIKKAAKLYPASVKVRIAAALAVSGFYPAVRRGYLLIKKYIGI